MESKEKKKISEVGDWKPVRGSSQPGHQTEKEASREGLLSVLKKRKKRGHETEEGRQRARQEGRAACDRA